MTDGNLLYYEEASWRSGKEHIAGVDEAGRGPIAGPVMAAAVILPRGCDISDINDSKLLTSDKRESLAARLLSMPGITTAVGSASVREIEQLNILRATYLAMQRALEELAVKPDVVFIDGNRLPSIPYPARTIVKGDRKSATIAAASILAKVKRDEYMLEADGQYPGYGFAGHKGYATAAHLQSLRELGPTPIHRKTFAPVAAICNGGYYQPELFCC
ncbi:MAG: ribonuclease HII, partial [Verrucomicrobiota bacterium]